MVKEISILDYDYELPDDRIPRHPLLKRDECRLLLYSPEKRIYHKKFKDLPDLLPPGSLLIWNNTKVINARLSFHKETGATIEIFLLDPTDPSDYELSFGEKEQCEWKCLVGNLKKWKTGVLKASLDIKGEKVTVKAEKGEVNSKGECRIIFTWDNPSVSFSSIIEEMGEIPIPPYLNRKSEESDKDDYQTVYALKDGSVAAPTAGLHFTENVIEGIKAHGVEIGKVTLHVGAGTFRPVKEETIGNHEMHSEPFSVTKELVEKLIEWKKLGKPIVATGTTTVRTLESLFYLGKAILRNERPPLIVNQWDPYETDNDKIDSIKSLSALLDYMKRQRCSYISASTSIIIVPGFHWRITDAMITNFHQPKSTLILLVSSFLDSKEGENNWKKIYDEALDKGYRFLSYGDACLFINPKS